MEPTNLTQTYNLKIYVYIIYDKLKISNIK